MLLSHISFSLGLIALVAGACLFLWSVRAEAGSGIVFAKVVGMIVIVLAILELLCTVYSGLRMKNFQREIRNLQSPMTLNATNPGAAEAQAQAQAMPMNTPAENPNSAQPVAAQ